MKGKTIDLTAGKNGVITKTDNICRLFDLAINNVTMSKAVNWVIQHRHLNKKSQSSQPELAFFINVNSINICYQQPQFYFNLQQASHLFADGIGMRLAADHVGAPLKDNVNGTDMLPLLCQQAAKEKKSIYLLGASPGVADKARINLQKRYPGLMVVGSHHGYFPKDNCTNLIEDINAAKADILLVALGSPIQENWLIENKSKLRCGVALAVGGLLDFYSGNMPRAPMWMRQTGLEWVYRLMQEPVAKFNRYVLGNPLFLIRTYLLEQARKPIFSRLSSQSQL